VNPNVDQLAEKGGPDFYRWFNKARVMLMFILGCGLIIYSVIDNETNLAYIIVGAVLIGLVPVDQWVQAMTRQRNGNGENSAP
jgi:hypothetical protein